MWIIRTFNNCEIQMVAVERILEFVRVRPEPPPVVGGGDPPLPDWPSAGEIAFEGVRLRYDRMPRKQQQQQQQQQQQPKHAAARRRKAAAARESDAGEAAAVLPPLVLGREPGPGLSFVVRAGERVAVVGRTGAGKSSLATVLFRLQDPCAGRVLLDGVDIASVAQATLRKRLSIVSQEPMLFSDTLRKNLDPGGGRSDDELWLALRQVKMHAKVSALPRKLEHEVVAAAENFSLGERQLLCMARALLRKSRVLVLDEATAAVDIQADAIIQATVAGLRGVTILTIAHRLSTVLAYDRIMVMAAGAVAEFGPPDELRANPKSLLNKLIKSM